MVPQARSRAMSSRLRTVPVGTTRGARTNHADTPPLVSSTATHNIELDADQMTGRT
jgi:hypothetical protein